MKFLYLCIKCTKMIKTFFSCKSVKNLTNKGCSKSTNLTVSESLAQIVETKNGRVLALYFDYNLKNVIIDCIL